MQVMMLVTEEFLLINSVLLDRPRRAFGFLNPRTSETARDYSRLSQGFVHLGLASQGVGVSMWALRQSLSGRAHKGI